MLVKKYLYPHEETGNQMIQTIKNYNYCNSKENAIELECLRVENVHDIDQPYTK